MRKISLIGMLALNILFSKPIHEANTTQIPKFSLEEKAKTVIVEKSRAIEYEILQEEFKYLREDKLYRIVRSCYERLKSEGLDIPDYITPQLIRAIARIESTDDPNEVSRAGAKGLWQIMFETWKQVDKKSDYKENVFIPEKNCEIAIKYWVWLDRACRIYHSKTKGYQKNWDELSEYEKIEKMSQAYNCGIGCASRRKWKYRDFPKETQYYFIKLDGALKKMFPVAHKYRLIEKRVPKIYARTAENLFE